MKVTVLLHNAPKKGEDPNLRQVIVRVREGNKDLRVRTDLMADARVWDDKIPGYRRTTRFGAGGMKAFNDKIADLMRLVESEYTPSADSQWLKETIDNFLNPKVEQPKPFRPLPCEDKEKDTTLEHLDDKSVAAWFKKFADVSNISDGRRCTYYSSIKKIRRYELYKREIEGVEGFSLRPDTFTIDDLNDFYDFVEKEHIYYNEHFDWYQQFHIGKKPPVKYTQNYMKTIKSHFRAFMNWMTKNSYTSNMEYKKLILRNEVYADPIYLTIEERDKLYYADLSKHPSLVLYRDMFMFQCLIGCRVSDLYSFTVRDITPDGFIEYMPEKTRENAIEGAPCTFCRVPLNEKAKAIINRNMDKRSGCLFPYRNKGMYAYGIKMLLLLCGIDRMVTARDPDTKEYGRFPLYMVATSHTARKTFIANVYKKVKDPDLISSLTGHVPGSKSFRRYRHIDDECKLDALAGIE